MKRALAVAVASVILLAGCSQPEAKPDPVVTEGVLKPTDEALSGYFRAEIDFPSNWSDYVDEWADTNFLNNEEVDAEEAKCVADVNSGSDQWSFTYGAGTPLASWAEPAKAPDSRLNSDTTSSWASVYATPEEALATSYSQAGYNECHERIFGEYLNRAYKQLNPHIIRVDYTVDPLAGIDGIEGAWGYRATTTAIADSGMSTVKVFDWAGFTRDTRVVNVTAEGLGAPFLDEAGRPLAASLLQTYSDRDAEVTAAYRAAGGDDPPVSLR